MNKINKYLIIYFITDTDMDLIVLISVSIRIHEHPYSLIIKKLFKY